MRTPAFSDRVGLTWLVTVRWTTLAAGVGAMVAGQSALQTTAPIGLAAWLLAGCAMTNLWLVWQIRAGRGAALEVTAGILLCADVLLLSWILWRSGGVLNPASVFYLVQIVVSALVLGRTWTALITALSVGGYATLFIAPAAEFHAAQVMHPEIALHMRGMWLAFALTAIIIGVLVTRLALAVERRDRALASLRERTARSERVASLATLAAGAAHELGTPLGTIAVAAFELERRLRGRADADLEQDARLIREETNRCRGILDALAAGSGEPAGEPPRPVALESVFETVTGRIPAADRPRLRIQPFDDVIVNWPPEVVARALVNLARNALQASPDGEPVIMRIAPEAPARVRIAVIDRGAGMAEDVRLRAGEPFFSTKPPGAGTGLGLFVARSSIEQLGGRLTIVSAPGQGTTVTVTLPIDVVTAPIAHA